MRNSHRCVIDSAGCYVEFVLLIEQERDGETMLVPYAYELKEGEALLKAAVPVNMIKARWNGNNWEETATPEEIEAAQREKGESEEKPEITPRPGIEERISALEGAMLAVVMGGMGDV